MIIFVSNLTSKYISYYYYYLYAFRKIKEIDDKKLIELIIEESKKHETGVFTKLIMQ